MSCPRSRSSRFAAMASTSSSTPRSPTPSLPVLAQLTGGAADLNLHYTTGAPSLTGCNRPLRRHREPFPRRPNFDLGNWPDRVHRSLDRRSNPHRRHARCHPRRRPQSPRRDRPARTRLRSSRQRLPRGAARLPPSPGSRASASISITSLLLTMANSRFRASRPTPPASSSNSASREFFRLTSPPSRSPRPSPEISANSRFPSSGISTSLASPFPSPRSCRLAISPATGSPSK